VDPVPGKMVAVRDSDLDTIVAWMVHLRRGESVDEVKGLLALDPDALAFEATPGEVFRLPYADMRSAKRLMGSPVLMVEWSEGRQLRRTAFYFVEPPPMVTRDRTVPVGGPARLQSPFGPIRSAKRKRQRQNVSYFAARGGAMRPTLKAWATEVSRRIAAAKTASE
jgi:hypothetical protein